MKINRHTLRVQLCGIMFLDRFQLIGYFPMLHYSIFVAVNLNLPFRPSSPESLQRPACVGPYALIFQ